MKLFMFVLLTALTAEAQSVGDVARKQRERRAAQAKTVHVFTTADAKSGSTPAPAAPTPATAAKTSNDEAKPSNNVKADANSKTAADLVQEWSAEMEKIRAVIRGLQDRETALQLEVNDFTNKFYAPVTTITARNEAQANLTDAQSKLVDVRKELARTRLLLQQMESHGPPKSK